MFLIKLNSPLEHWFILPSELSVGEDDAHQRQIGGHPHCAQGEDEGGFGGTPRVALEHPGCV